MCPFGPWIAHGGVYKFPALVRPESHVYGVERVTVTSQLFEIELQDATIGGFEVLKIPFRGGVAGGGKVPDVPPVVVRSF